jgi:hypothetical protein
VEDVALPQGLASLWKLRDGLGCFEEALLSHSRAMLND